MQSDELHRLRYAEAPHDELGQSLFIYSLDYFYCISF